MKMLLAHMDRFILGRAACVAASATVLLPAVLCLFVSAEAFAQRPSIDHYGVADGLPHYRVWVIYQDRKGYLWFGTDEGLSRFDGNRFVNYGTGDGLPSASVTAIVEDRSGELWVATTEGVARLVDDSAQTTAKQAGQNGIERKKFISYPIDSRLRPSLTRILFDARNGLWCATAQGLYYADRSRTSELKFNLVVPRRSAAAPGALADREGHLWFAYPDQLIRVADGRIATYDPPQLGTRSRVTGMTQQRPGRLLVSYQEAVFEFTVPPDGNSTGVWRRFPVPLATGQRVLEVFTDSARVLWIGTSSGLIKYGDGEQTDQTAEHDLHDEIIHEVAEDREGNIWVGTSWNGVYKIAARTIVSFKLDDLPSQYFVRVLQDRDGRIYGVTREHGTVEIVGERARLVPLSDRQPFNTIVHALQDRRGDWWIGTRENNNGTPRYSLFRFSGPKLQFRHGKKLNARDGITGETIPFVNEDAAGRVWASLGGTLHELGSRQSARPVAVGMSARVVQMISDRFGALWLASSEPAVRRSIDGETAALDTIQGLPKDRVRAFFQDSRGWLWIAFRDHGVSMTTDPAAARPTFVHYSTQNGLASNVVTSIAEDEFGRIYLGTNRGLDRLDPETDRIRHFTTADGLASDAVFYCMRDRAGHIWIATTGGISRLNPRAERASTWRPNIYLTRAQAAGQDLSVPERGAQILPPFTLPSGRDSLMVEYVGLRFRSGPRLKYQYRLDGVDREWSPPTDQRAVNYARLGPGTYRFLVRAINPDDGATSDAAVLPFQVPFPIWMRWWFVTVVAFTLVAGALALHRLRVRQILAMERIRRQIATDLHDDVGSGLSQIAILSEVAKRQSSPDAAPLLTETANVARAMRESMSDIVWAIDPKKDRVSDLVRRMKQASFNTLQSDGLRVEFLAPDDAELEGIGLTPDRRRHVLLMFKEAITNVARHAQASRVRVAVEATPAELRLRIEDDGRGFDPQQPFDGNGMHSLRQRASALQARLEIDAAPGRGTTLQLKVPL